MENSTFKRIILAVIWITSAVFTAGLAYSSDLVPYPAEFTFVQVSDTHIGFIDPKINPDAKGTLKKVISMVNDLDPHPDFVVFTGDLTHTTSDAAARRASLRQFKNIASGLTVKDVYFLPGEHDAGLDGGAAFMEVLGKRHYSFTHKGVHFVAIDNVSDPASIVDSDQMKWLADDLNRTDKNLQLAVLTHRPLFDLYPQWDWWTRNGADVRSLFKPFNNVEVFYGHIHQLNDKILDGAKFHSAMGTMYPLPAPGSVEKKAPVPWDAASPYKGLGFRSVLVNTVTGKYVITEHSIPSTVESRAGRTVRITAKKFKFTPDIITLYKGVVSTIELTSLDVMHGFSCPGLNIRNDVPVGTVASITVIPKVAGECPFFCDVYCGEGHEDMSGKIIVK